jgi:N-acetylmuramoyl-L-alanine amidase
MLILHYTGMASAEAACRWLCDPASKVSCHYLVDEAGRVTQTADEMSRAWHAGAASWQGDSDVNSRSIGIEIHNPGPEGGYPDFPEAQMASVITLAGEIVARHKIRPEHVLAHSDVAPGRKVDPGEKFDWARLAGAGIARFGYGIAASGVYDAATRIVVAALQRHFRPGRMDGIADGETQAVLRALLKASGKTEEPA